jgi:hypothetical protein
MSLQALICWLAMVAERLSERWSQNTSNTSESIIFQASTITVWHSIIWYLALSKAHTVSRSCEPMHTKTVPQTSTRCQHASLKQGPRQEWPQVWTSYSCMESMDPLLISTLLAPNNSSCWKLSLNNQFCWPVSTVKQVPCPVVYRQATGCQLAEFCPQQCLHPSQLPASMLGDKKGLPRHQG